MYWALSLRSEFTFLSFLFVTRLLLGYLLPPLLFLCAFALAEGIGIDIGMSIGMVSGPCHVSTSIAGWGHWDRLRVLRVLRFDRLRLPLFCIAAPS